MKKSCAVIGVVFLFLLAAVIGVLVMKAPQWWASGTKLVQDAMAEQKRIEELEAHWTPPSETPDAAWAPATLGPWKLKQVEAVGGWPDLKVTRPGQRMVYENGGQTFEIGVVAANDLENEVLSKRILEVAQSAGTGHMITTIGNRTHVKSGNSNTRVWWLKNWLFFFRSRDVDPKVEEEYLNAISGARKVEKE